MLKKVTCEIFREQSIEFHNGLNVVLGDNAGSNSIGKSTLLMIIDFVFGGSTYISFNKDVVAKLGHHDFLFTFQFKDVLMHFSRSTQDPNQCYICNEQFEKIEMITTEKYCSILKENYEFESGHIKFRSAIGQFFRVWGKNNYDVKRPLHSHHSESNQSTVNRLLMLLDKYDKLSDEEKELKKLTSSKSILNKAGNLQYIPKITKTKYNSNLREIEKYKSEIEEWKKSVYSPVINIPDIISNELIELRERKGNLLKDKEYYKSRLYRTNKTISKSTNVGFDELINFFPNVKIDKLQDIENFHNGISSILGNELKNAKTELQKKIQLVEDELALLNLRLEELLNPLNSPNLFIESLLDTSNELKNLEEENKYYDKLLSVKNDITEKTITFDELKNSVIEEVQTLVNLQLENINKLIHSDKRTPPTLSLSLNDYNYKFFDNTGTGKAYANLIIFDLAMLRLTRLPCLIHDSILLDNIERDTVEQIIALYKTFQKQIFIAVDEIQNYSKGTQEILLIKKVIQLTNDKLLFTLDWRDDPNV